MVFHCHVTSQCRRVGHDDATPHMGIVSDMAVSHKEVVVPEGRDSAPSSCAAIDRNTLAKQIPAAYPQRGHLPLVFEILGVAPDRGEAIESAGLADRRPSLDMDVRLENRFPADLDVRADDAIGADADIRAYFCGLVDDRRRVNAHANRDPPRRRRAPPLPPVSPRQVLRLSFCRNDPDA